MLVTPYGDGHRGIHANACAALSEVCHIVAANTDIRGFAAPEGVSRSLGYGRGDDKLAADGAFMLPAAARCAG